MEFVYTDEPMKKADVCGQLHKAVIQFCEQTYAGISHSNLEVDGIICISFSNSCDQHVVKIHEKLGKGRKEVSSIEENVSDCLSANISEENVSAANSRSSCGNYNRISDEAVNSGPQTDSDILSYDEQDNASLHLDADTHIETFSDENVNKNEVQNENLCGAMNNSEKSRKELKNFSPKADASPCKKKKQFVESVEGNYVIVKVEPEDLDAEEQENLKDTNVVQSCFSHTTKTSSFSPKSGSYIRQDSVEKLSVVDDSNDTMYMVTSDFNSSTSTETYPYQPSVHNSKSRDRGSFTQGDSSLQFVNSSSTPDVSDLNQHEDINDLARNSYPQNSVVLDPFSTKQMNKKPNRRSTGSIKQSSKSDDFVPTVFQNFNVPLAPLDPAPGPLPISLSSTSLSTGYSSDTQLNTSLPSQYYNYNSNSYASSFSISSASSQLPGAKPRLSSSTRSHGSYSNRGRSSALSHAKRSSVVAVSRNANFSTKLLKRNQKSAVPNVDLDSKSHFAGPLSDSFIPSPSCKYKVGQMDTSSGHDKLFFCRYCGKGFTMKCTRSRHEKTICSPAGAGSYRCELCPKSFTRSDSRYRHMYKAHGIQS
ncbi:zinc finger protein MSN2-like [Pecten maximus]|uniref:zinc finger protein MSN2-like n=1 Tax=Pecten maximus TaxID=6579 RepID=UPI001458756A|nr:zinc finger protein MSN2-like [Pecten maximus]XP_033743226.1 zinc finger protein MSN2-like [Pecten maximus]XP_033743227.1 zinc finger protein MSN2-like [Pecten maximus]XP_033743228.1 zinc finger protein MSN2-like [Pecten maximus]XP_033743229.1 zinc finger protein MSN2-like [Pecten maximus]XP_033743232.1 zinc finger protein MSN2-like [Pecten maximus]